MHERWRPEDYMKTTEKDEMESERPSQWGMATRLCIPGFYPFRTCLILRNPPDSGDSVRFCRTLGIKSSRARLICPKSDGIRPESGGKDK